MVKVLSHLSLHLSLILPSPTQGQAKVKAGPSQKEVHGNYFSETVMIHCTAKLILAKTVILAITHCNDNLIELL